MLVFVQWHGHILVSSILPTLHRYHYHCLSNSIPCWLFRGPSYGLQDYAQTIYKTANLGAYPVSNAPEVFLELCDRYAPSLLMVFIWTSTHSAQHIINFHIIFTSCLYDSLKTDGKLDLVVIDTCGLKNSEKNGIALALSPNDASNNTDGIVGSATYANSFLWETCILFNRNLTNILRVCTTWHTL